MIRLSPEHVQVLQTVLKTQPRFVSLLKEWKDQELGLLPQRLQNTAVYQGRCQVLDELLSAIESSPETAAKPLVRRNNMHTE